MPTGSSIDSDKKYLPPPAPRSRLPVHAPSLSLGTCPVRLLAAPRPARGGLGKMNKAVERRNQNNRADVRSLQGSLTTALPLMWLRSIESREHSYTRKLVRRLPALYLATLRHSHQFKRKESSPHPPPARACLFTPLRFRSGRAQSDSSLPPAPPAGGVKTNKTLKMKQNTCRAPRPGGPGPRTPRPSRPRCSARARFAINTIMNK